MPGHGKTVLVSYHLGQPSRPIDGFANGAILALTHVGLAVSARACGLRGHQPRLCLWRQDPSVRARQRDFDRPDRPSFCSGARLRMTTARPAGNGRTLAFVTGMIPCPLTTFVMSYCAGARHVGRRIVGDRGHDGRNDRRHWREWRLSAAIFRNRFVELMSRTENARHRLGQALRDQRLACGDRLRPLDDLPSVTSCAASPC